MRYPRAVIDRPFTYPEGMAVAGLDLSSSTANFVDPATVRIFAGYGITDDLEVNFGHYQFETNAASRGSVDLGLGYRIVRGKVETVGRVQTGYALRGEAWNPLLVGVTSGYNITPKLAVFTPGGQLRIALSGPSTPIDLAVPIAVGYQPVQTVWTQLEVKLATINISGSSNSFLIKDTTPLTLTTFVNVMPELDGVVSLTLDATPADKVINGAVMGSKISDTASVTVGVRYYVGQ